MGRPSCRPGIALTVRYPGFVLTTSAGGRLERALRPRHRLLLALSGGQISAVRDHVDLHDGPYAVVDDDLRKPIAPHRVHGELERAVVDLILGRDGCAFTPAHGQSTFERKPGISKFTSQGFSLSDGALLGE